MITITKITENTVTAVIQSEKGAFHAQRDQFNHDSRPDTATVTTHATDMEIELQQARLDEFDSIG